MYMLSCSQMIALELQVPCIAPVSSLIRGFQALPELPSVSTKGYHYRSHSGFYPHMA
jgi:hypothetical protein